LRKLTAGYKKRFGQLLVYDVEEEIGRFREYRQTLAPFCVDAVKFIKDAQDRNAKILIEGANALMLDIDYGEDICPLYTSRRMLTVMLRYLSICH
jgi:adenylosuccinate synthase